jgi:hypothetical protein
LRIAATSGSADAANRSEGRCRDRPLAFGGVGTAHHRNNNKNELSRMTNAPAFRQIASPLDIDDAQLDQINRRLGVPTLVTAPVAVPVPPIPVAMKPTLPVKAVNVHLPAYVVKALKDKARLHESSVRYVIMLALAGSGIEIDPSDLVMDARRSQQSD